MLSDHNIFINAILQSLKSKRELIKGNIKVVHIVTPEYIAPPAHMQILFNIFDDMLNKVCSQLNIQVERINSTTYNLGALRDEICTENSSADVDAVIYDYPFNDSTRVKLLKKFFESTKDIGFCSEQTMLHYYANSVIRSPFTQIVDWLRDTHMSNPDNISYAIITNNFCNSHRGIIPFHNRNFAKYTLLADIHPYKSNLNDDIVISLMTSRDHLVQHIPHERKYSPKVMIDFGYTLLGDIGSIDSECFKDGTPIYTWENGLTELYVYAILSNLLSTHRGGV